MVRNQLPAQGAAFDPEKVRVLVNRLSVENARNFARAERDARSRS